MKKLILCIAAVAMMLPSCKKINESLDSLGGRLDKLEQERIPSIDEQIAAINTTLSSADAMDKELKNYIDSLIATATNLQEQINSTNTKIDDAKAELKNDISTAKTDVLAQLEALETELKNELAQITATIVALQAKDAELDSKITELKNYVDTELCQTTDWISATFATLEQYNALVTEVATIKEQIKAINDSITILETNLITKINEDIATAVSTLSADIQQKVSEITTAYISAVTTAKEDITAAYTAAIQSAISTIETSLKAWVGEQLANYYTIAEVDAKITALQNSITEGDSDLQEELNKLEKQLETTASELTEAYKKAIEEAINANNGVINAKIANDIAAVNQRIDSEVATINAKITALEARLDNVEVKIAELLARIQSVSYIPTYSDNKATVKYYDDTSIVTLDFEISPKDAVVELAKVWREAVSIKAVYTQTRAVSFIDMPIMKFETDAANGVITVTASGKNLLAEFFAATQEASCRLAISDGNNSVTSDYISMVAKLVTAEEIGNEIWYTSTDAAVVTPYKSDVFGANIVSNTYENGKGVIKFDIPITSIGGSAFEGCSSLASVTIPNSVTSIGEQAFCDCSSLTSVSIPDSVTSIGNYAFTRCSRLKDVHISDIAAWCRINFAIFSSNPLIYAPNIYLNNELVTDLVIPDSVTSIGDYAFYYCSSLTSVTIPDSVTTIGNYAFDGCKSLASVTIPNSVTSIGHCTFSACWSLVSVSIPDSVTEIGEGAFWDCSSLTSVSIGNGITSIGEFAFAYCSSLAEFKGKFASEDGRCLIVNNALNSFASAGLTEYIIPDVVTSIGFAAFYGCSSLASVTIPDSVTSIGDYAFIGCSSLASVSIPDSVTEIGDYAFDGCKSLTSVTIPDSVTEIGDNAFWDCSSLASVSIGNSVTSIGVAAFYGCSSLASVTIPDSVTEIGVEAFAYCSSLASVYCKPTTPPTASVYIFYDNASDRKIYVPTESVKAYKSASGWSNYADAIVGYDF